MKKCAQCGFSLKDTDKFCMQCGRPVPKARELAPGIIRCWRPRWLWAGAGIILVAMIGSAAWVVLNRTTQASPPTRKHHTKSRVAHQIKRVVPKKSSTNPSPESETTLIAHIMSSVVEIVVTTS